MSEKPRFTELMNRYAELENILAGKKVTREVKDEPKGEWKDFVERPLTEAEIGDALDRKITPKEAIEKLVGLPANGFKVGLGVGKDGQASMSITDYRKGSTTYGFTLMTWADDPATVLVLGLYKHYIALGGDWSGLIGVPKGKRVG